MSVVSRLAARASLRLMVRHVSRRRGDGYRERSLYLVLYTERPIFICWLNPCATDCGACSIEISVWLFQMNSPTKRRGARTGQKLLDIVCYHTHRRRRGIQAFLCLTFFSTGSPLASLPLYLSYLCHCLSLCVHCAPPGLGCRVVNLHIVETIAIIHRNRRGEGCRIGQLN